MPYSDRAFEVMPGDIVSISKGRGWKLAKVVKSAGEKVVVMFKDGHKEMV